MPETQISKIQTLLEQAAAQKDSNSAATSSVECATRVFESIPETEQKFAHFRGKLFRISDWNGESEISSFYLFDENGIEQPNKAVNVGDFIKIILPGSGKADWVKVISFNESPDEVILTFQPSIDPTDSETETATSHFFTHDSTNNFCLQKHDRKINFCVVGLCEKPNTTETSGVLEMIRNYATANIGLFLGVQKAQWQTFCDNFLEVNGEN